MEKLLRVLCAAFLALTGSACSTKYQTPAVFLPSGEGIVAATENGLQAVDLRSGKALWKQSLERPVAELGTSPRGGYVLVEYPTTAATEAHSAFVVLSTATGQITGQAEDPVGSSWYKDELLAGVDGGRPPHLVSDDGKWFVSVSGKGLRIFDVGTAKPVFEDPDVHSFAGFGPGSPRLAALTRKGVGIYALGRSGWVRAAEFRTLWRFWWTSKGLFTMVEDTLNVWQDGTGSALFPLSILDDESEEPRIFFDEGGDHVAVQSPDDELVVYTVPAGDAVLRVPKFHDLRAVGFEGKAVRALSYVTKGDDRQAVVTEYDLSKSRQRGRVELEVVQRLDRPGFFSFGLGGGWQSYRSYAMAPRGRYVGLLEKDVFEMTRLPWVN